MRTRQPPRRRHRLLVIGMDTPRVGPHQQRQGVHIGRDQLRQLPVLQNERRQRVHRRQRLQHIHIGRGSRLGLLHHGQAELLEEDHAELLGGADGEGAAGRLVDSGLQHRRTRCELHRQLLQQPYIEADAGRLHPRQHPRQRHLHLVVKLAKPVGIQPLLQHIGASERHIGILCRVGRRLGDRDLIKPALFGTHTGHLLVGDGLVAQQVVGQAVEVVAAPVRIEQVGRQHRVAADGSNLNPLPRQNRHLILGVLPHLHNRRVGQHGTEQRHHLVAVELPRRQQVLMGNRNVDALVGAPGERDAHNLRIERLDRGRLQVKRDPSRSLDLREAVHQLLPVVDGAVGLVCSRRLHHRNSLLRKELPHHARQPAKLQLPREGIHRRIVGRAHHDVFQCHRQRHLREDGRQLFAQPRLVGKGPQVLFPLHARHLVDVRQQRLHIAKLLDELARRQLTNAGHARDVVRCVAREAEHICDAVRHDRKPLENGSDIDPLRPHRIEQRRPLIHKLRQVLVARQHHHIKPLAELRLDQRPDDIIGLVTRHLQHRDPHRLHELPKVGHLRDEVGRHLAPVRLVGRIHLVAEGAARRVKGHRKVGRPNLTKKAQHHVREGEEPVRRHPLRGPQLTHAVEGTEDVVGAIEQVESLVVAHRSLTVRSGRRSATAISLPQVRPNLRRRTTLLEQRRPILRESR